jgi:hypothetical protein
MHWSVVYTWHQERHLAGEYDSREEAEHWAQHLRDHEWHAWIERAWLNGQTASRARRFPKGGPDLILLLYRQV